MYGKLYSYNCLLDNSAVLQVLIAEENAFLDRSDRRIVLFLLVEEQSLSFLSCHYLVMQLFIECFTCGSLDKLILLLLVAAVIEVQEVYKEIVQRCGIGEILLHDTLLCIFPKCLNVSPLCAAGKEALNIDALGEYLIFVKSCLGLGCKVIVLIEHIRKVAEGCLVSFDALLALFDLVTETIDLGAEFGICVLEVVDLGFKSL